jgi:hypothetical protein
MKWFARSKPSFYLKKLGALNGGEKGINERAAYCLFFGNFSFRKAVNPDGVSYPGKGAIGKNIPRMSFPMAERKGFEPLKGFDSFNGLANRRLQPLGHLSGLEKK